MDFAHLDEMSVEDIGTWLAGHKPAGRGWVWRRQASIRHGGEQQQAPKPARPSCPGPWAIILGPALRMLIGLGISGGLVSLLGVVIENTNPGLGVVETMVLQGSIGAGAVLCGMGVCAWVFLLMDR